MTEPKIILNRIKCNHCDDVLTSHTRHMFVTCSCGTCSVDGGRVYLKRLYKAQNDYTELSVHSDTDYSTIRQSLYRGSTGITGRDPLKWVALSDIDYLPELIKYCEDNGYTEGDYKYYLMERDYRDGVCKSAFRPTKDRLDQINEEFLGQFLGVFKRMNGQ